MSFKDLLAKPAEQIEAPKALPIGTYDFLVKERTIGESTKKKTPFVRYVLIPMSAHEDVDPELLADYGAINKRTFNMDYYLTEDSMFRLVKFLEQCGSNMKLPVSEIMDDPINKTVTATVTHQIGQDGKTPYAQITDVVKFVE